MRKLRPWEKEWVAKDPNTSKWRDELWPWLSNSKVKMFIFIWASSFCSQKKDNFVGKMKNTLLYISVTMFSSVQSLSCVRLFATPWITAHQASLFITNSRSSPKPMSIELVMPSNHLILIPFSSCPQSFPASGSFQMSQLFSSGGQSIGVSASTSVLPMNTQDWPPLRWTGWISLQSKGLSRVFSNTTVQKHQFCAQLSL